MLTQSLFIYCIPGQAHLILAIETPFYLVSGHPVSCFLFFLQMYLSESFGNFHMVIKKIFHFIILATLAVYCDLAPRKLVL